MTVRVKGEWRLRAVETTGQTVDVLLTEPHDEHTATRCLATALRRHGVSENITIQRGHGQCIGYHERHGEARHCHRNPQHHVSQQHC